MSFTRVGHSLSSLRNTFSPLFLCLALCCFVGFRAEGAQPVDASEISALDCNGLLTAARSKSNATVFAYDDKQSVETAKTRMGLFGGKQILLKRIGDHWASSFALNGVAIQGDPTNFAQIFGDDTARFFGFETVDEKNYWVPDAEEFIKAYEAVRKKIEETGQPAPLISFYPQTESNSPRWDEEYLKLFANSSLPIAHSETSVADAVHLSHDLSYHATGALLLHPEVVRWASELTQVILEFAEFLENSKDLPHAANWARTIRLVRVLHVDSGTANLGSALRYYLASEAENHWRNTLIRDAVSLIDHDSEHLDTQNGQVQFDSYGPLDVLPQIIRTTIKRLRDDKFHTSVYVRQYLNLDFVDSSAESQLIDALNRFIASRPKNTQRRSVNYGVLLKLLGATPTEVHPARGEELCLWAAKMRDRIQGAAEALLTERSHSK